MVQLALACAVSLLPERWRQRWLHGGLPLGLATHITAALQVVLAVVLFAHALWAHFHVVPDALGGAGSITAPGAFWYLVFWLTPRGLVVAWLLIEGVVRFFHAFHDEPLATLPLAAIDAVIALARSRRTPPAADRVTTLDDGSLVIDSASAYAWTSMTTIRHADRFWRLRQVRAAKAPWRHAYHLELAPRDHLIRNVVDYPPRMPSM